MVIFGGRDADDKFLRDMAVFIVGVFVFLSLFCMKNRLTLCTETRTWVLIRYEGDVAPAGRAGHATTLLPDGTLMLFGGYAGDRFFDDFWAFSFGTNVFSFVFCNSAFFVSFLTVLLPYEHV